MSIARVSDSGLGPRKLSSAGFAPAGGEWRRNPSWLAMPAVSDVEQKIVILTAVRPDSEFVAFTMQGAYTVDWGDGSTPVDVATNVAAQYLYDYTDVDLDDTDGPVTFTDTGDLVGRTAHGYQNGDVVTFWSVATTTGVDVGQQYYVINASANTFQISLTPGGSAVALTGDGSGTLLPYKQALITITPQSAQNLTSANFQVRHSTLSVAYSTGFLDMTLSGPSLTTLTFGGTTVPHRWLERANVLTIGSVTSLANMFQNCLSLQSVPLFNTAAVTTMSSMFFGCSSLQSVPLFNTAAVTTMASMFQSCSSLQSVPLFNTAAVTTMSSMFFGCPSLQSVPLFNTASVTNMSIMFQSCASLQSVPLFNTASVTNMSSMFNSCFSLQSVPLFNTAAVTNMSIMFFNCPSLQSVPALNTAAVTTMASMFQSCFSLQSVPLFNTAAVTTMASMFQSCSSLQSVPLFNTASVTNMSSMFFGCSSLQSVPALNSSAVSSSTNFNSMFVTCPSLARIEAKDFSHTFSVASCKLGGAQLDEIYTNLPTVSGQTITVTGNYGTATHDPTIATGKGWTVTA
jgi:surface protein